MRRVFAIVILCAAAPLHAQWITCGGSQCFPGSVSIGRTTAPPSGDLLYVENGQLDTELRSTSATGFSRLSVMNDANKGTLFYAYGSAMTGELFTGVPLANLNMLAGYGSAFVIATNSAAPLIFAAGLNGGERMRLAPDGSFGIGTPSPEEKLHVVGNAKFTGTVTGGNIKAKYQDVAEWVPTTGNLPPGTVVVIDSSARNRVIASAHAYDTSVAGVVSAQPGLSLGEEGLGKAQVATVGRVKVRVDATRAPIAAGDVLVTSQIPGTAMKSECLVLHGISMHRPGTIIGKALEPLARGTGEILVLLTLQ